MNELKGLKFVETLKVTFDKVEDKGDKKVMNDKTAYFNSSPQTMINDTEIADSLRLTEPHILNKVA